MQLKPESWNMTVPQPQSLEKKVNQHKLSQAHIPIVGVYCKLFAKSWMLAVSRCRGYMQLPYFLSAGEPLLQSSPEVGCARMT